MLANWRLPALPPWALAAVLACCTTGAVTVVTGCDDDALKPAEVDAGPAPGGLTRQQAQSVIAKVGEMNVTLGDFAAALERMNQFDRLRYQTTPRRRELLQEIIDVELLAQEAVRRGLDKNPEVQAQIRQVLREAILAEARSSVMPPAGYSAAEVKAYYDQHVDDFREPERRRVGVIQLGDPDKAEEVLDAAKALTDGAGWGELYFEHSLDAPQERNANAPADLAGDRGIVGPPGDPKGANNAVPEPIRKAVFAISEVGKVYPSLVKSGGKLYVVRLAGLSEGHTRSLEEADRAIRVALMQAAQDARMRELEADMRKRFSVVVDDAALAEVRLPSGLEKYKPFWEEGAASANAKTLPPPQPDDD